MYKNLRTTCAVLLLCFAFTVFAHADGDTPIAGNQCNPAIEDCSPKCIPGMVCPDGGGVNRAAAVSAPSAPAEPTLMEQVINALKKFFG